MARITLTIEAEDHNDLHETLAGLCDQLEGAAVPARATQDYEVPRWGDKVTITGIEQARDEIPSGGDKHQATEEALSGATGTSAAWEQNGGEQRRRRTKAELEADPEWRAKKGLPPLAAAPSAAEASPTSASATPAPTASAANLDFTRRPSSQLSAASPEATAAPKPLFGIGGGTGVATQPVRPTEAPSGGASGDAEAAFKAAFRESMARRGAKATQDILVQVAGVRMTAEVKAEQYPAVTAAFLAG